MRVSHPHFRAETFLSIIITIVLFSLLMVGFHHWQNKQIKRETELFQKKQATQIARNQLARQLAELSCEMNIIQNEVKFNIECSNKTIKIVYPLGEFHLKL